MPYDMDGYLLFETLEDKLAKKEDFLSAITGLPITGKTLVPEDPGHIFKTPFNPDEPACILPFSYSLTLGSGEDSYSLDIEIIHKDRGEVYAPSVSWSISRNSKELASSEYTTFGVNAFSPSELTPAELKRARIETLLSEIGGISAGRHEVPFMDYESFSVDSLNNGDASYFRNIYLILMCNMKERGLQMPPIISKSHNLSQTMEKGDVEGIEKQLSLQLASLRLQLDDRSYQHVLAEAECIRGYTMQQQKWLSPRVPLTEKVRRACYTILPGMPHNGRKYNIFAVENDLSNYGKFTDGVIESLKKDGRYGGSAVWKEENLPSLMDYCNTGQVDILLFDWRNPSYEEMLQFRGDYPAGISYSESGELEYHLSDGSVRNEEEMEHAAEGTGIRDRWMDMIENTCIEKGVATPPHFIILYESELRDISKIVSQKLGLTLK